MGNREQFAKNLTSIVESVPSTTITDVPLEGTMVFQRFYARFKGFAANKNNSTPEAVCFTAAEDLYSGDLILRGGTITVDTAVTGDDTAYTLVSVKTKYPNGGVLATWAAFNVKLTGTGSTGNIAQFARVNIPSAAINTQLAVVPRGGSVTVTGAVSGNGGSTADMALEFVIEAQ